MQLQLLGIPVVLLCLFVVIGSSLYDYFPMWVGTVAGCADALLASYLIGRIRQLRDSSVANRSGN